MSFRTILGLALLLALAFGLGYAPKEWQRRRLAEELQRTQLELRLANLHRQLGIANYEAQRNNFGLARNAAHLFFDGCRDVVNEHDFQGQPRTRLALQSYASYSDPVMRDLANANPAVKERLASLFVTMNGVLERRQ